MPETVQRPRSASVSTDLGLRRSSWERRAWCSPRSPTYRPDDQARAHVFCHAVPGTWHAMGVMLSAAGSLQWLRDTIAPDMSFEALVAEAATWRPGAEGLVFLPYLQGERTPHADPDARGAFTGLQLRHNRGALVRAVLEGVAFGLRDSFDILRGLGIEVSSARASGGGARSELWLRICASVLDVPIERTVAEEGSAFGAALLGGVAGGVFTDVSKAVAAAVQTKDVVEPDAEWARVYGEQQHRYRALYPALRDLERSTVEG